SVFVAIGRDFADDEAVSGGFAFHPELVARAAVECDEAGIAGALESHVVHEADHEDAVGRGVLYDRGDQTVEFFVVETHMLFFDLRPARGWRGNKKARRFAAGILSDRKSVV